MEYTAYFASQRDMVFSLNVLLWWFCEHEYYSVYSKDISMVSQMINILQRYP